MTENTNNTRQTLESFRNGLQERIKARIAKPSVADSLSEKNKEQAEKKSPWFAEFRTDKATYVIMGISAVFTAILGLILGLAPYRNIDEAGKSVITFNTDFMHWTIAIVYAVSFVTVTEAAFLIAKNKFHTREEGNFWQSASMFVMMLFAGISIIGTGYAGGVIGASVLGFLTEFQDIPKSAQEWVVKIIPVLLAVYAGLLTIYKLTSEEEKEKRLTDQLERKQLREHKLNRKLAELEVADMLAAAEDMAWVNAVERGALTAGDVAGARKAGKSLKQLERDRKEDLDGDGMIANTPAPLASQESTGNKLPWQCGACGNRNPGKFTNCLGCGAERGAEQHPARLIIPAERPEPVYHSSDNGKTPGPT